VLNGLLEAGLEPPVAVVGSSVGALNGSAIAAYPSLAGILMLRQVWLSRQALTVFHAHPLGVILSGLRHDQLSAFPQENVRRLIDRAQALTGMTTFEQLRVPLAVVATDLNAGKPVVFRSGLLTPALLASTAIPAFFHLSRSTAASTWMGASSTTRRSISPSRTVRRRSWRSASWEGVSTRPPPTACPS